MQLRQKLEWGIKCLIYLTFITPIIVIPSYFIFPFIVPKIIFFRTIIQILVGLYVLLLMINWQKYKITLTPITWAVLLFYVLSFGISTFLGINSYHSFWDNHERMLGFFTILHYVAFYLIATQIFKSWSSWKWALRFFLFCGSIVMFIAFLQTGDPYLLMNMGSQDRVSSTLGNPIYVGGFSIFLMFVAGLLLTKEKNRIWKYTYTILMFLAFMGIFWSGTRGSLLALLAGLFSVFVFYFITIKGHKKVKIILLSIFILFSTLFGILYANRDTNFVKNITTLERVFSTDLTSIKESNRFIAWRIAWEGFTKKPIFGWGPNNFYYVFNQYYDPRSLEFGYPETWFDNAHNIVMNTLAVQGGLGIITYLTLFIISFIVLIKALRQKKIDIHIFSLGGGFLVAHFVGNITVFENITSYLYFMFWLAMLNYFSSLKDSKINESKNNDKNVNLNKNLGTGSLVTVGFITFLVIFIFNIRPAQANIRSLEIIRQFSSNPKIAYQMMVEMFNQDTPHIDDIRNDSCRIATQFIITNYDQIDKDFLSKLTNICYEELEKNIELHPLDIRVMMTLSQLAQIKGSLENNSEVIGKTISFLEQAREISPKRQQILYSLAMIYIQIGQADKSIQYLTQAINDNPKIAESYWRLAFVYSNLGEIEKAEEILAQLENQEEFVLNESDQLSLEEVKTGLLEKNSTSSEKNLIEK